MESIVKDIQKKAKALIELTGGNAQAISSRIAPIGFAAMKANKLTSDQAKELGAIMLALLTVWSKQDASP